MPVLIYDKRGHEVTKCLCNMVLLERNVWKPMWPVRCRALSHTLSSLCCSHYFTHANTQQSTESPCWALVSFDILLSGCVDLRGYPLLLPFILDPSRLPGSFQALLVWSWALCSSRWCCPHLRLMEKDALMKSCLLTCSHKPCVLPEQNSSTPT